MSEIEQHERQLMSAFARILRAEDEEAAVKLRQEEAESRFQEEFRRISNETASAWADIARLMGETGEVEVLLRGEVTDFKIGYGATRESVKATNPEAIPDEFCRTEKKPMLKEIGEHLRTLRAAKLPLPNWAHLEQSEPKLGWKAVKKSTNRKESV